jgi:hypothetical protein
MILVSLALTLAAADAPAKPPADPSQQMVCRRETLTGTRFGRKICLTKAQREATAEADYKAMQEMRQNMAIKCRGGDGC